MTTALINPNVDTIADLLTLLPQSVADTVDRETLRENDFASALRMLASIKSEGWHRFVRTYRIDWDGLLAWARREFRTTDSVLVRIEIAASLAGHRDSQALLMYGARALDDDNYAALMDALRIAREGVAR